MEGLVKMRSFPRILQMPRFGVGVKSLLFTNGKFCSILV